MQPRLRTAWQAVRVGVRFAWMDAVAVAAAAAALLPLALRGRPLGRAGEEASPPEPAAPPLGVEDRSPGVVETP